MGVEDHVPGTMLTTYGREAMCSCGWRSGQCWEETDEGHEQAHLASHQHVKDATGQAPPGRVN